jgi:hypothetical protein
MGASVSLPPGDTKAAPKRPIPYQKILLACFLLSLPIVNPTVHGDGVGYYAYARALLIQHNMRFEEDWKHANPRFAEWRMNAEGDGLNANQFTPTGYVDNRFTVGPAMLWAPFLIAVHFGVLLWDALGGHVNADGFSTPYLAAMAVGSAVYGYFGLLLSFALARKYARDRWAFLATLGIWLASSLPVYMYFNPSWSHAHSAFSVALFLWYWDKTRKNRNTREWILLGLSAGLMVDVYLPNGVFLLLPLMEVLQRHWALQRSEGGVPRQVSLVLNELEFIAACLIAFLPTLITRKLIYGGFFRVGAYSQLPWDFKAPHWWQVLFSSDHGAMSWTPVLMLAVVGLLVAPRKVREVAAYLGVGAAAFYYVIACYPYWDGLSSFGNRFFISLTCIFIFGLALLFERVALLFRDDGRALVSVAALVAILAWWNLGLMFQWGEHLIPVRGEVSFAQVTHNQLFVVPKEMSGHLRSYLFRRKSEMHKIEQQDIQQQEMQHRLPDVPPKVR